MTATSMLHMSMASELPECPASEGPAAWREFGPPGRVPGCWIRRGSGQPSATLLVRGQDRGRLGSGTWIRILEISPKKPDSALDSSHGCWRDISYTPPCRASENSRTEGRKGADRDDDLLLRPATSAASFAKAADPETVLTRQPRSCPPQVLNAIADGDTALPGNGAAHIRSSRGARSCS